MRCQQNVKYLKEEEVKRMFSCVVDVFKNSSHLKFRFVFLFARRVSQICLDYPIRDEEQTFLCVSRSPKIVVPTMIDT